MYQIRSRVIRVIVATTLSVVALSSRAYADGIKSQWKVRMPLSAGVVLLGEKREAPQLSTIEKIQMTASKEVNILKLIVTTKVRTQLRIGGQQVSLHNADAVLPVPKVTISNIERIRSIRRSMRPVGKCSLLHTHEKARCLRDQQYARTNQYAFLLSSRLETLRAAAPTEK